MKEDLMSKIDYIGADNGGLALFAGNVTIRATTVEAIADANLIVKSTVIGYSPTLPLIPSVPNILLFSFIFYLSC